jgi:hypothetical protein
MGVPHLEHAKMPISARLKSGSGWVDGKMHTLDQAGAQVLSVTGNCRQGAVMEPACSPEFRRCW